MRELIKTQQFWRVICPKMDAELQEKGYYISPKIELVQIEGKGRGFVAREPLKVGELIFKEKPLAVEDRAGDWHNKFVRVLLEKKEERELIYCPPKYPILPSPIKGTSNDEYSRMMSQITTNAFQKGSTAVLTARSNLFNSSCWPNLVLHCKDNFEIWGYVIDNVQPGEEVCNNFPDLYMTTKRRRDLLKNQYGFDCDCKRCNNPDLFPNDKLLVAAFELPDDPAEKQAAVSHMEKFYNSLDYGTPNYDQKFEENPALYIEKLEEFIKQPFGSRWPKAFLGKCHWRLNVVRQNLIQELMAAEKLERAIDLLIDQMIANDKILPKWHLQKLTAYTTLNELMARLNLDRLDGAIKRLKRGELDLQYYKELFFMYKKEM